MTTLFALASFIWALHGLEIVASEAWLTISCPMGGMAVASEPVLVVQAPNDSYDGGWGAKVERDRWGDEEIRDQPVVKTPRKTSPVETTGADRVQPKTPALTPAVAPPTIPKTLNKSPSPDAGSSNVGAKPEVARPPASLKGDQEAIRPPSGTIDDLFAVWDQRRLHVTQRDFELAHTDLEKALRLQDELGLRNLEVQAQVLIREAARAKQRNDSEEAVSLINAAAGVAPDLSAVYRARAGLYFSEDPGNIKRWGSELLTSFQVYLLNPLSQNRLLVNLIVVLLVGIGLVATVVIVVQLVRYGRLWLHDFHHIFPYEVARFQTVILGVLLLLLPILLGAGLLITLLWWLMVVWLYEGWSTRIVSLVMVGFFATTPIALDWVVRQLGVLGSRSEDLLAIEHGSAPRPSLQRITNELEKQPEDVAMLATMAHYHKRVFELGKAHELYDRALQQKPDSEVLLNNLGNVLYLEGNIDAAFPLYQRATQIRPDLAASYFNLSTLYFNKLDLKKGNEAHAQAQRLDASQVRHWEQEGRSMANHVVVDMPVPDGWLESSSIAEDVARKNVDSLWHAWGGFGSPDRFPSVAAGYAGLLLMLTAFRRKFMLSKICTRCGRPACRRCNIELKKENTVCGQCFHAFVRKEKIDSKSKIAKELQIRHFQQRQESIVRGINFLLPGAGQLIAGRTARGLLFLLITSVVLVQLLIGDGIVRSPASVGGRVDWVIMAPLVIVLVSFYLWAVIDGFRRAD
jgi:tetratricopeptide (TPR) repeat protein